MNYTENIQQNVLISDLADDEIQLDLLGDENQNMTLQEEFQFVEAKDADERSAGRLLQIQGVDEAFSQYHRNQQDKMKTRKAPLIDTAPTATSMAQSVTTVAKQTTLQPCATAKTNPSNHHRLLPRVTILEIWGVPFLALSAQ